MTLFDVIPGYREAVVREQIARDEAFIGAPEIVCGVEVRPFTLRDFALLDSIGSPLLYDASTADETDLGLFFWIVSYQYQRAIRLRGLLERVSNTLARVVFGLTRYRFIRRLRHLRSDIAHRSARDYIDAAMMDAPKGGKADGSPSYWGTVAGVVGILASAFGWAEQDVLDLPCKRVFQYVKIARKKLDPGAVLFNPSDKERSRYVRELNAARNN